ncbi:hypothetical protein PMAYCL1PPCAC_26394, partial [Pristionchus mayeri]
AYHAIQNYKRFKKTINTAATYVKNVDGSTGEHIARMIDTLDALGRSFHLEWNRAWTCDDDAVMRIQQKSAVNALKEVQKSIARIYDIFQHRKKEYELQMATLSALPKDRKRTRPLPQSMMPSTSMQTPLFCEEINDALEIRNEEHQIKEEPMEIKEEPLDEPIADTFCPGGSQPTLVGEDERSNGMAHGDNEGNTGQGPSTSKKRIVSTSSIQLPDASTPGILQDMAAAWGVLPTEIKSDDSSQWKQCFICLNRVSTYYVLPKHEMQRQAFFNRIIHKGLTRGVRARLIELIKNNDEAQFCTTHVLTHKRSLIAELRGDVEPTTGEKCIERLKKQRCNLCGCPGGMSNPFTTNPKEPAAAKRFFHRLINVTYLQRQKLAYYASVGRIWTVCGRHLPPWEKRTTKEYESYSPGKSSDDPLPTEVKPSTLPESTTKFRPAFQPYTVHKCAGKPTVHKPTRLTTPSGRILKAGRYTSGSYTAELEKLSNDCDDLMRSVQQRAGDFVKEGVEGEVKMEEP